MLFVVFPFRACRFFGTLPFSRKVKLTCQARRSSCGTASIWPVIGLLPLPSLYLRCRKDGSFAVLQEGPALIYVPQDVVFFKMYDPRQQVYGLPGYIGVIHSVLLNSEATIFRRRYYNNGAHMGFILYTNDPSMTVEMETEIKDKIAESKGNGNFRNMFINER